MSSTKRSYTYNGVTVQATGRRSSSRDDKKYERTVTVDGKDYIVHYGDPNMEMQRDIPERREAFLTRHSCDTKKDPLAPGFWACLDWARTDEGKAVSDSKAVKMLGRNRVGGYMMLWGDEETLDLDGEYFTADTAGVKSIFDSIGALPYLYNHAMDDTLKSTVIGKIDVMVADDVGMWYEAQLDQSEKYRAYIDALRGMVAEKKLGTSSGALPGSVKIAKSGQILSWAVVEGSATPTPADPRQITQRPISEIKSAFKALGLDADLAIPDESATDAETEAPKAGSAPAATVAEDAETDGPDASEAQRLLLELDLLQLT